MRFPGLDQTKREAFERFRLNLHKAREAARETATAYDEALAEVLEFVREASFMADDWHASRSDDWHKKHDHAPKELVSRYSSDWHHALLVLEETAINFDAVTEKHAEILDELRPEP